MKRYMRSNHSNQSIHNQLEDLILPDLTDDKSLEEEWLVLPRDGDVYNDFVSHNWIVVYCTDDDHILFRARKMVVLWVVSLLDAFLAEFFVLDE